MTDAIQAETLNFLADPGTHGLGAGDVGRVRTHISELFLAGDLVYKVKRAVAYSFVDFQGLDARRSACEAELALNRRTAPDIYLGLAAIRRDEGGGLVLERDPEPGGAAGEIIEWAVVMRRFDTGQTLDHLAERGELNAGLIADLVDAVVDLHEGAAPMGPPFGGAEGLGRIIEENAMDMGGLSHVIDADGASALATTCRAALGEHSALLDARRQAGFVRRCHGDLHLGNVVLWQGRPTLFDCIEFSDSFACIDVLYDFAFLLMDLDMRGLRPLANAALSRFIGRVGQAGALAALPLMLSVRAAVRAKVNAMAVPVDAPPVGDDPHRALAARYMTAAADFLRTAKGATPGLVAIGGLSGSGKTTIAAGLAPGLGRAPGAVHLRSDLIRKRCAHVAPEVRLDPATYTPEADRAVYETLMADAEAALRAGQWVVADAVFARPAQRQAMEHLAAGLGLSFLGIWLEAPVSVMGARVEARCHDASDATLEILARQLDYDTGDVTWARITNDYGPEAVLAVIDKLQA
jgi:aminoglycoside phosphotransferase family enzyme/predicted kinase